jgi:MFS family permease
MNNDQSISKTGLIVWVLCGLFFTYEFLLRTVLGTFEHPLINDLQLSLIGFAILSSTAYQLIYGCMQMPAGLIIDKFGLKKTIFLAISVCTLSVIGFSLTHHFDSAFVFRILMGFGSSFGFLGLLVAVYDWMPAKKIGLFIGLSQFIGTLGPMFAAGPLNAIANTQGASWRIVFMGLGLLGVILGVLTLLFVKNNHEYTGSFQILKKPASIFETLSDIVGQRQLWFLALYSGCVYFTIEYLSENSGKSFLILNGYTAQTASNFITLAWLGYAIGCPFLGFLSDRVQRRASVLTLAAFINLIGGLIIIYLPSHFSALVIGFVALGLGASGQSVAFAAVGENSSPKFRAAALGFNNAFIVILTSTNAPIIAAILAKLSPATNQISVHEYQQAFIFLLLFMFIGLVCATFLVKETFCKSMKSATTINA